MRALDVKTLKMLASTAAISLALVFASADANAQQSTLCNIMPMPGMGCANGTPANQTDATGIVSTVPAGGDSTATVNIGGMLDARIASRPAVIPNGISCGSASGVIGFNHFSGIWNVDNNTLHTDCAGHNPAFSCPAGFMRAFNRDTIYGYSMHNAAEVTYSAVCRSQSTLSSVRDPILHGCQGNPIILASNRIVSSFVTIHHDLSLIVRNRWSQKYNCGGPFN